MDDIIAQPSAVPVTHNAQENELGLSDDDEDTPDWTKLKTLTSSLAKPVLPKRGDKEFEPAYGGPSSLQTHSLNRSRDAMFSALQAERVISNQSISYAIWYPEISRAATIQIRGVLFNGIGHSVPRPVWSEDGTSKLRKRTELLPEETLYLIERGSLFCWRYKSGMEDFSKPESQGSVTDTTQEEHFRMHGVPMTVQQAFSEMIGKDDLTLEKYNVYAYLKRLGFNVLRAHPPNEHYPNPPRFLHSDPPNVSIIYRFKKFIASCFKRLFQQFYFDWWRPVRIGSLLGCAKNYPSLYKALRFIPSGHKVNLYSPPRLSLSTSPYQLFYNVYKPITPFRKTAPPAPDFYVVVVNARTTLLPTLRELTDLYDQVPETGPPLPRQKNRGKNIKPSDKETKTTAQPSPPSPYPSPPSPSFFIRLFSWFGLTQFESSSRLQDSLVPGQRPPHPFAVLKNGKKTVVIAAVDCGVISFYRFSSGAFEEMPIL